MGCGRVCRALVERNISTDVYHRDLRSNSTVGVQRPHQKYSHTVGGDCVLTEGRLLEDAGSHPAEG
jgi:hypothetical protein